jgi:RND family efflux transporter MFP subunit
MAQDLKDQLASLKIDRSAEGGPEKPGRRRALVAVLLGVLLPALTFWIVVRDKAVPVRTALATEAAGSAGPASVLNASGYVTARRQATVSSKITGKVVEINVEEGMKVEEGQVLARLDDRQARSELELAKAQLAAARSSLAETEATLVRARKDLVRHRDLAGKGVSSQAELDSAQAEADALAARLARQKGDVEVAVRGVDVAAGFFEDTVIRAPFSGVAISKDAQPGEMVSPVSAGGGFTRTGISTIVDMTSLEVEVDVNEAYIQRVVPNQKVRATLDAYPESPYPAHVITTIPSADREKATVAVRIGFDQLDPRILPDMGVKVAFLSDESAEGSAKRSVTVPRAAIRSSEGATYVLVVSGEGGKGTLERRAVRLAAGQNDPAEAIAGISAGERVVVEGPADLAAGAKVREKKGD